MRRPRFSLSFGFLAFTLIGVGLGQCGRLRIEQANYRRQTLEVDRVLQSCRAGACEFHELPGRRGHYRIDLKGSVTPGLMKAIVGSEVIMRVQLDNPMDRDAAQELERGFQPLQGGMVWVRKDAP